MTQIHITREDGPRKGRYVAHVTGIDAEAELTFTHWGPDLISADHTGAPEVLRGTGAAAALVDFLVADAREHHFRIIPICPYVRARYAKHPEWHDVMTVAPSEAPRIGSQ
ncbi:GNAT family N-acetyltransferase [Novosphingobium profundi]|uniref:GNAT family N-acetyltransferase n=1 Tax=Novosphingobium profundi TaxID=1774954 RepID=UPI001CFEAB91|nr:GNAT family N-acetyltransferase [Novosphingobium profundi]